MCLGLISNAHCRSEYQREESELKSVTEGVAMATEELQGSSGAQRNTIDGGNVYVFAKEDHLRRSLIYQVRR